MLDKPLRQLADDYAELIAVVDRADALSGALALVAGESQVAWLAWPTDTDTLRIEEVIGNKTNRLHSLRVPRGKGLTGKVFRTGQLEWVNDYFASRLITHAFDSHIAAEEVRRLLAVPLVWQGKILGVLAVGHRDHGNFGDQDFDRVSTVAARAALAVTVAERVRLTREIAVHEERRRVAARLHHSVGPLLFAIGSGIADLRAARQADPELHALLNQIQRNAAALRDEIRSVGRTGTFRDTGPDSAGAIVTAREYDVLRLVAAGYTNPEIGEELHLSLNTVKSYLRAVMQKLAARNRAQLISNARQRGLF